MKTKLLAIMALLLFAAFPLGLSAQVGNTGGPAIDWERDLVCWNDGSGDSTLFQISLYVVGQDTPVIVRFEAFDGTLVDVSGDQVTPGPCAGNVVSTVAGIDYQVLDLCDDGTPFYRFIKIDESDDSTTDLGDFDTDFSAYTVTGTVTDGPCVTTANVTASRIVSVNTAGSIAAGKQSCEVCNTGFSNSAYIVDGGAAATLYPGSCWKFVAYLDPVTRIYRRSPAVSWDNATTIVATSAD